MTVFFVCFFKLKEKEMREKSGLENVFEKRVPTVFFWHWFISVS